MNFILRLIGCFLVGIAVFLFIFIYEGSNHQSEFFLLMILPNLLIGILLIVAKEKKGYPE